MSLGDGVFGGRALSEWPKIDFVDDRDGCLFAAKMHREPVETLKLADKGAIKVQKKPSVAPINAPINETQVQLLNVIRSNPAISYDELAHLVNKDRTTVMRNIGKLKDRGFLKRAGSRKTGHWEIID